MSANRKSFKLNSDKEARESVDHILFWCMNTPSAVDKLPKYVLEHVDMVEEYTRLHGKEWLLGGNEDDC